MLTRNYKPGFRADLFAKDLRNVATALTEYHSPAPVSAVVQQLLEALIAQHRGEDDYAALATVLFDLAGLE
jgi:2-hydroxy-3-oxopropionate reductase